MTPVVLSGGELTSLADRPYGTGGSLQVVPRLDKDGTIIDLEVALASLGDPEFVYRTQPMVRMVVDWRVSRMVRVAMHAYLKDAQGMPVREDDAVETALSRPLLHYYQPKWLAEIAYDWLLHDKWLILVLPRRNSATGTFDLVRLPAHRWRLHTDGFGRPSEIRVDGGRATIDPAQCVFDIGRGHGTSPMHTLQDVLREALEGGTYRRQVWANGIRARAVIERPADAPDWTNAALQRFGESFGDEWSGPDATKAGGVPVLEDGMKLKTVDLFSPADTEYMAGLQLAGTVVCGVFDTAPELVGLRATTFANMDALRQSIYRETLGGDFTRIETQMRGIAERITAGSDVPYLRFNIEAALRGSFQEQTQQIQSLVGRPIFTGDEGRALFERSPLGGNMAETVVPLNVLIGGLASPRDTARPEDRLPPAAGQSSSSDGSEKADLEGLKASDDWRAGVRDRLQAELAGFFGDQAAAVTSQLAGKADGQPLLEWDGEKWNAELAAVLLRYGYLSARIGAKEVLERFAVPEGAFSEERLLGWLRKAAENTAERTNQATHVAVAEKLAEPDWQDQVKQVFTVAAASRAVALGSAMVAETASFGAHDAAGVAGARVKTWRVRSPHPRASHSALNGQTVPVDGVFGNGLRYPGDSAGSAGETAGCTCSVEYGNGG